MKHLLVIVCIILSVNIIHAQTDSTKSPKKILLVAYPSMLYFSDADPDLARFSRLTEQQIRNQMRLSLESNVYHRLQASFNTVSLLQATSLNGEADLNRIYAASRYYTSNQINAKKSGGFASNLFRRKNKKQTFYVTDSATMIGEIQAPELQPLLHKKYEHDYILYLTQFEVNTSNKNTIEWLKQDYKRTYVLHYNLWDNSGKLILAETLTLEAGGENTMKEVNEKYLAEMAAKLQEILKSTIK